MPSDFSTSTASPSPTWRWRTTPGGPSAVDVGDEGRVERRDVAQGLDDGVADQVGEADLGPGGPGELVVQDLPVDLEQLGRHRPDAGRRRHAQAGLHVGDDPGRRAPQRHRDVTVDRPPSARRPDGAGAAGAGAVVAGSWGGRPRRSAAGTSGPATVVVARTAPWSAPGSPRRCRPPARSGRWSRRDGRRRRRRAVVGEELAPALAHRRRVDEVTVVHVVDQPGVGPEGAVTRRRRAPRLGSALRHHLRRPCPPYRRHADPGRVACRTTASQGSGPARRPGSVGQPDGLSRPASTSIEHPPAGRTGTATTVRGRPGHGSLDRGDELPPGDPSARRPRRRRLRPARLPGAPTRGTGRRPRRPHRRPPGRPRRSPGRRARPPAVGHSLGGDVVHRRGPGRAGPVRLHRRLRATDALAGFHPTGATTRQLAAPPATTRPMRPSGSSGAWSATRPGSRLPEADRAAAADGPALVADLRAIRGPAPFDVTAAHRARAFGRGGPASAAPPPRRRSPGWPTMCRGPQLSRSDGAGHGAHLSHPDAFAELRPGTSWRWADRAPAPARSAAWTRHGRVNVLVGGSGGLIGRAFADQRGRPRPPGSDSCAPASARAPTDAGPSGVGPGGRHHRPGGPRATARSTPSSTSPAPASATAAGRPPAAARSATAGSGSTRLLVDALPRSTSRPACSSARSAVGYYGDRGDEVLDRGERTGTGSWPRSAGRWEAEAERDRRRRLRVVLLRTGVVLTADGRCAGPPAPALPGRARRPARQRAPVRELDLASTTRSGGHPAGHRRRRGWPGR